MPIEGWSGREPQEGDYMWWEGHSPPESVVHRLASVRNGETPGGTECYDYKAACGDLGFSYGYGGYDATSEIRPEGKRLCPTCFPVQTVPYTKNEHGHYVVTFTGTDLPGKLEVVRLTGGGFHFCGASREILTIEGPDGYDSAHRLVGGQEYQVALIVSDEAGICGEWSLLAEARRCGYGNCLAGMIPRLREVVSNQHMAAMGIKSIIGLHAPIKHSGYGDYNPSILTFSDTDEDGRPTIGSVYCDPIDHARNRWSKVCAFPFPIK